MEHFGVSVHSGKYGLKLDREKYAIINNKNSLMKFESMKEAYADEQGTYYTDEWCQAYREKCLINFDLNMNFYLSLNHDEFEEEIQRFLRKNEGFTEVHDLKDYEVVKGYYVMVLDEYCQVYVGTSDNIKGRIQQHWKRQKNFDRLLCPMDAVETSSLSIDSFRALDTTRIYAYKTDKTYEDENRFINEFSCKFVTNRIAGGKFSKGMLGAIEMAYSVKSRELMDTK